MESRAAPMPFRLHNTKLSYSLAVTMVQEIVEQGWSSGQNLGCESELMARYGISRDLLREALRILEWQGIAKSVAGRFGGLRVQRPAREAILNMLRDYIQLAQIDSAEVIEAGCILNTHAVTALARRDVDTTSLHSLLQVPGDIAAVAAPAAIDRLATIFAGIGQQTENQTLGLFVQPINEVIVNYLHASRDIAADCTDIVRNACAIAQDSIAAIIAHDAATAATGIRRYCDLMTDYCRQHFSDANRQRLDAVPFWVRRQNSSLSLAFLHRLGSDIHHRADAPGLRFGREPDLMANYRVSRSVFREAVRMLEFLGLVEQRKGRYGGLFRADADTTGVVSAVNMFMRLSGYDYRQLQVARQVIDEQVVLLAIAKISDTTALLLRAQAERVASAPRERFIDEATQLHYQLADIADNRVIRLYLQAIMQTPMYSRDLHRHSLQMLIAHTDSVRGTLLQIADAVLHRDAKAAVQSVARLNDFINTLLNTPRAGD